MEGTTAMKTWTWRSEWAPLSILAAMLAAAAWVWPQVPERMPVHWNLQGEIDRYGGRFEGVLLLPLVAVGIYLLLLVLPRFDPGRENYAHFRKAYSTIRIALLAFLAALYAATLTSALGHAVPIGPAITPLVGALLLVIGLVLGKLRPNWFVGIRTPWTLSSKRAWTRSHRLGGWLFAALGLATLGTSLIDAAAASLVLLWGGVVLAVTVLVHSYLVWRTDPDRVPPAGTLPAEDAH
jgi:uncharacterized membrane protein